MDEIQRLKDRIPQLLPQVQKASGFPDPFPLGDRARLAEADDERHGESAGAQPPFVAAAFDLRNQPRPGLSPADGQRADALRTVDLMRRKRSEIDILRIEWNLAYRLCSICVEEDSPLPANPPDLGDRMDDADLIVGVHHGNQDCPVRDRAAQSI